MRTVLALSIAMVASSVLTFGQRPPNPLPKIDPYTQGEPEQLAQLPVGQGRHDQKDAVGAHESGITDIIGRDGEIFAKRRKLDGAASGPKVRRRAPEMVDIGEYRQTRCTACRVLGCDGCWIEVGWWLGRMIEMVEAVLTPNQRCAVPVSERLAGVCWHVVQRQTNAAVVGPVRARAMRRADIVE